MLIRPEEAATSSWMVIERYTVAERLTSLLVVCPYCIAGIARARKWANLPEEGAGVYLHTLATHAQQDQAIAAISELLDAPRGWLTLAGDFGRGKTQLMYAALNHLADLGVYGRYFTAPSLLDELRQSLRDTDGNAHSELFRRLAETPVLAIDELDKYSPTGYAEEAIFKLFDARYRARATHATLLGFNLAHAHKLPPFLVSRMHDGRFKYIEIGGVDLRPYATPEVLDPWDRGEGER